MWISLAVPVAVPVAVLLAPLLLQRLEAKLLSTRERIEHPDSLPLLTAGPLEPSTRQRPPQRPPQHRPLSGVPR